jgi:transcriptional regulator with XRE-family HTH domain
VTDTALPARIRRARKDRGLTQVTLAASLGTSQGVVSAWETGERTPTVEGLASLATTLGVSADWLLGIESA